MTRFTHTLPVRVVRAVMSRGLTGSFRRAWFLLSTSARERRLGIRTEATIPWRELSDDEDSVDYEASGYRTLQRAFTHLEVAGGDVFLDLGCGMGRPLVVAARQPFRRVIGVELSPELAAAARENLAQAPRLRCGGWEVVCCGADQYEIPDDVSVLYLFNPFRGETLRRVSQQIEASLARRPRTLTLLYVLPVGQQDPFAAATWLRQVADERTEGLRLVVHRATR